MRPAREAGRPRRRKVLSRAALAAVAIAYVGLLCAWLYRPDPSDGMSGIETALAWVSLMATTFAPHAGLGLISAAVVLAALRARAAAAASVPLAAACLGPWAISLSGGAAGEEGGPRSLLVLSANLLATSDSDGELLEQIGTHQPDVIVLQEVRAESLARLERALAERYPHVAAAPREHLFGEAVFSALPFAREARVVMPEDGRDLPQVMVWVEWGGEELCVWNIHLHPPTGRSLVAGQAMLAWRMGGALDGLAAEGTEAIVAGDFNAPWGAQPLDALRERGFREAHRAAGEGAGASWPRRGLLSLPPGIRIDHVAYSNGLECVEAWGGAWTSSDHRPQFARFVRAQ